MKFKYDYNVIVIGAGSAGLVTSYIAAALKAKVLLVEKHKMGGDCLNTGCVPSKALIRSAKVIHYAKRAKDFGIKNIQMDYDFADVMERVQTVIGKIEPHDSVERYTNLGVECLQGMAMIKDPHHVEVDGKVYSTKAIVVATGARPFLPPIPGMEDIGPLHSDNLWQMRKRPKELIVLGAGPIGCELSQAFSRLDCNVKIIERGPRIMPREDEDVSEAIQEKFANEGIDIRTNTTAVSFHKDGEQKQLKVESHGKEEIIPFDEVIVAVGRRPNTTGFGLENLDIEFNKNGTIAADPFLATTKYKNIFVCGDVAGPYQFTHTAAHQAYYTSVNSLFSPITRWLPFSLKKLVRVNYDVIPWATYTDPEVATVGLTETAAKQQNIAYEVTKYGIDDLDRAITESEDHGFVKVLTQPGTDKIIGATIVGSVAGDMLTEFTAAMKNGFGLNAIMGTIHPYPTMSEANKFVSGVWKQKNKPEKALEYLQKFHTWRRK